MRWLLGWTLVACGSEIEAIDPRERFPGGDTTNTLLLGGNAFLAPASNLDPETEQHFHGGNGFFNQSWVTAPASTMARDGLGPTFNARSCSTCHFKDGRGRPPEPGEPLESMLLRISNSSGAPDERYGDQLQSLAIMGVPAEATPEIVWETESGRYDDGEAYTLRKPRYGARDWSFGEASLLWSGRVAPQMIGLGLLEAIGEDRLAALADPDDADGDGISGRVAWVESLAKGRMMPGRFGWKAEQPTVRDQTAGAFLGDMGLTSALLPEENCPPAQTACLNATNGGSPEVSDTILDRVETYSKVISVPVRRNFDSPEVERGRQVFWDLGCNLCHIPSHVTGPFSPAALAGQTIWPYTDLLLHDLGEGLADDRPAGAASGTEWKTPPLWGLGLVPAVNRHLFLLHDGRADGFAEAILWHGGEAESAQRAFKAAPQADRRALVAFLESL